MRNKVDRKATIWVVDDSPMDAEGVRRLLAEKNYDVEVLQDGAVTLERLSSGAAPDLLLLDWVMPGVSGIEVCRYMRSPEAKLPPVPILLLTARHGPQEIAQAFSSGANDYISKPFVAEELLARTQALLESRRLLERAEQAESDLRSLLTNSPDPLFVVNANDEISFVNAEGLRILDADVTEVLDKKFAEFFPEISLTDTVMAYGQSVLEMPDVKFNNLILSPSLRLMSSDSGVSTSVVLRDVTARRRDDSKRLDFYSVIAHDLRTPITSVLLRLQMALRGKHGVLPVGHIEDLHKSEVSLRYLMGMINDFLEFARLESLGYKMDMAPVSLGELTSIIMDDFSALLEKNQLTWDAQNLSSQETVLGDRKRLAQVLTNLISNAIKFTPAGGKIIVKLIENVESIEISVQDTGRGIPKEQIKGLFEKFSRVHETEKDVQGTGLGLMIVREIIEAHGGLVGVESEVESGSRFWFKIPRNNNQHFHL